VREHRVQRNAAIRTSATKRKTGRSGGKRFEAEMLEVNGCADIPWIGQDETALRVQIAESLDHGLSRIGRIVHAVHYNPDHIHARVGPRNAALACEQRFFPNDAVDWVFKMLKLFVSLPA
jgi:hypothetical protein